MEIQVLTPAQADLITEYLGRTAGPALREMLRREISEGEVCIGAIHNGQVVGYTWISTTHAYLPGLSSIPIAVPLGQGWGWGHRTYTLLAYRGRGIHQALLARRNSYAKEAGLLRCANMTENDIALHNFLKGGCVVTGSYHDLRLLRRWRRTWSTGGVLERLTAPAP